MSESLSSRGLTSFAADGWELENEVGKRAQGAAAITAPTLLYAPTGSCAVKVPSYNISFSGFEISPLDELADSKV
jgi:hypothetical protein